MSNATSFEPFLFLDVSRKLIFIEDERKETRYAMGSTKIVARFPYGVTINGVARANEHVSQTIR